jgi:hypothetical protein
VDFDKLFLVSLAPAENKCHPELGGLNYQKTYILKVKIVS